MFYDLFTLCVLGFTTMRGAAKGIAWQLAGIAAIVLCFAFATPLSASFAPSIPLEAPLNRWVAMLGIYLAFSFVTFGCARGFEGWMEKIKFKQYDQHLGALFGLTKGVAFSLVMTFFVVAIAHETRPYILKTYTGFTAAWIMDRLDPVMPEELHAELAPYIHELDQDGTEPQASAENHTRHSSSQDPFGEDGQEDDGSAFGRKRSPARRSGQTGTTDAGNQTTASNGAETDVEALIRKIPGLLDRELRKLVMEALKNTLPEDRAELVDKMNSAPPEKIQPIAKAWRSGKPAVETRAVRQPQPAANQQSSGRQRALIRDISTALSKRPEVQSQKATEIAAALDGVPDQVSIAVLSDWKSDLLAINPDPDPETDLATPLDTRIARQMQRAGAQSNRLSGDFQERPKNQVRR